MTKAGKWDWGQPNTDWWTSHISSLWDLQGFLCSTRASRMPGMTLLWTWEQWWHAVSSPFHQGCCQQGLCPAQVYRLWELTAVHERFPTGHWLPSYWHNPFNYTRYLGSVPAPLPAFHCLQYRRAWYIISLEWCRARKDGRKGLVGDQNSKKSRGTRTW